MSLCANQFNTRILTREQIPKKNFYRPGEPRGPLNISNVHKNGCTLDWKPPADDGGAPVSHYVVEKQDLATGRWVPAGESTDCAIDLNDLQPGHEYKSVAEIGQLLSVDFF